MFGRKDQYYQQKGISILAYAVSGSDIPTVLLLLTAGNIFSTGIVLQNVSVYWTELTFERTLWVQTVLRFPTNSLCTVELAFKEMQTSPVIKRIWHTGSPVHTTAMPFWWAPKRAAKQLFIWLPLPGWYMIVGKSKELANTAKLVRVLQC